jgi:hypothetical protein
MTGRMRRVITMIFGSGGLLGSWVKLLCLVGVIAGLLIAGIVIGGLGSAIPSTYAATTTPLDLGQASSYAVLSGLSVGNTVSGVGDPYTTVRGDLGVLADTQPTGFPPGVVTGAINVGNAAAQAYADLTTAYDEVAAMSGGTAFAGDLAGATLTPGLHSAAAAVSDTGTVTLDGGGDPNAVFILKIGGALNLAAGAKIKLADGTQAQNVFWQVNGAAAIGANATFTGTLMAANAIAIGAGAEVNGRALALNGTVSLDDNQFYSDPPPMTIDGGPAKIGHDVTPTIAGTTGVAAGTAVTARIAGQTIDGSVGADGTWHVTPTALSDGTWTLVASVTDPAGNVGTATQQLTVDTVPPIITIAGGPAQLTNDVTPTFAGTSDAAAGTTVTVTVEGQTLTALVQSDGTWNVTPTALDDGAWPVLASVTDPAGNVGTATEQLTVDTVPPTITIDGGADAVGGSLTPTITGTSDAATGTAVTVTIEGQTLSGLVTSAGTWQASPVTLTAGTWTASASVTDPAGNVGTANQQLTVASVTPPLTLDGGGSLTTNDTTPTFAGTSDATAGATVTVTVDGQTLTALVQADGRWNVTPSALPDGTWTVIASVTDQAGDVATATQQLTVDTVPPAITIDGGATAVGGSLTPTIAGMSDVTPGTPVTVTIDGQTLTGFVTSTGIWQVTPTTLTDGTWTVRASVTDPAGNVGSVSQQLTVASLTPAITLDGGPSLLTDESTPTFAGTSDLPSGTTVTVTIDGQTLKALVQSNGTWNVTAAALRDGTWTLTASVTDQEGNIAAATQQLTIDRVPAVVTIGGGANVITNDRTPDISGTADVDPGTPVTVDLADQTLTSFVDSDGDWSVTTAPLADGPHRVVMSVLDGAGNLATVVQTLTVDTVPPAVTISGGPSTATDNLDPTIKGTSSVAAGTLVTVSIAGQMLTTLVQRDGTWNTTPRRVGDGAWMVVAHAADSLGNVGTARQSLTIGNLKLSLSAKSYRVTHGRPLKLRFSLGARADVTLRVTRRGSTVVKLKAVSRGAGRTTLTWNGRINGRPAARGPYGLLIRGLTATGSSGSETARLEVT